MIRFYAYYSVGGYKELYLGDNRSVEEYTYYLPLLPVYKKRLENIVVDDSELRQEVERLSVFPPIKEITWDNKYELPEESSPVFSHDGYSLIYRHLIDHKQVIAIREIPSLDKDSLGREIPFLFCLVCDELEDWDFMDRIATYFAININSVFTKNNVLASILHMDSDSNGLRFSQREFVQWLETAVKGINPCLKFSNGKDVAIHAMDHGVALLIKPNGMSDEYALERQEIQKRNVSILVERDNINSLGVIHCTSNNGFISRIDKKILRYLGVARGVVLLMIILLKLF